VDPAIFSFKTTAEVEKLSSVVEQDRALEALQLGLSIQKRNFNIYLSGASGTGKSSILKRLVDKIAADMPTPPDWCMVHNFKHPETPAVFQLPAGEGLKFRCAMEEFINNLKKNLPKLFHGQKHQELLQGILNEGLEIENKAFKELNKFAEGFDFQVKQTKEGLMTIPIVNGETIGNKEYAALDDDQRKIIDDKRKSIEPAIAAFFEKNKEAEHTVHAKIQEANHQLCDLALTESMDDLTVKYAPWPDITNHLTAVRQSILDNIPRFLAEEAEDATLRQLLESSLVEYKVNLLVDNSEVKGAPVIFENTPTYHNLVGRIEKRVENGIYSTDFTLIKAGSLLRANGGFLVLHTRELVTYPFAWESLKAVLRQRVLEIAEMGEAYQFLPTTNIRPDPIPMSCKVILIGSNYLYHLIYEADEEFGKAFQIKAEFDSEVHVSDDMLQEYARFIATTSERDGLLPVDRKGVADVIEYSMRMADASDKLTLQFNLILNLLIEADHLARLEHAKVITAKHIIKARKQRTRRVSLSWDKGVEAILRNTIIINSEGVAAGVVNGLAVYQMADQTFGMPLRISARAYKGSGGVLNIEREAKLSGNSFNKAVMIISGLMGDLFAQKQAISMTISLTVEQSYGGIDGDSASCAEFCTILSALSGIPLRQDVAITGSLNQTGDVQAIGGVNEKIEGFFRICESRGLTGNQGVIIPAANIRNLVLEPEVEQAVKAGKFNVWAIDRVEEAIEILTGRPAGTRTDKGVWSAGSVFAEVEAAIEKMSKKDSDKKKDLDKKTNPVKKTAPAKKKGK
jgi:lon-related putative ATP-dependent protease